MNITLEKIIIFPYIYNLGISLYFKKNILLLHISYT